MTFWGYFSILGALNGGLLHRLHWPLLWVAFLLLLYSAAGVARMSKRQKSRQLLRRNLANSVSALRESVRSETETLPEKPMSGEQNAQGWAGTLVASARRLITTAAKWVRTSLGLGRGKTEGASKYAPIGFCAAFALGLIVGLKWPQNERYTYYGLRVREVVDSQTWKLISPATGPFTADFCSDVSKYQPQAGYVLCKMQVVDRGCMDVRKQQDGFWWVKDRLSQKTVALGDNDSFQPWPTCLKDEPIAQGGPDAR
jgi:hypothetical protein